MQPKKLVWLSIAMLALTSCGASTANTANGSAGSATTVIASKATTTSTQPLIPTSPPLPALCSAYFTVVADVYLEPKIVQLSAEERNAGALAFSAALKRLRTSPLAPPALSSSPALGVLSRQVNFAPTNVAAPIAPVNAAVSELKQALGSTCQPVRPSAAQSNAIIATADSRGWSNSCSPTAAITISSADPTYAVLDASASVQKSPGTACFADGSTGALERLTAKVWNVVQTYTSYPCGEAPPDVLYSLFGTNALDVCYP